MLAVTYHRLGHGFPWNAPADEWCERQARDMLADGYSAGAVLAKIRAYGCGFHAAGDLMRRLMAENPA